tara:strand:+ start:475 stop:681 length:207 start_codon:yes stop_codon:yes gene_type:complete
MSYDVREKTEVPENFGEDTKKSKFPYKSTKDPKYLKDRAKFFKKSGNGWWCKVIEKRGRIPLSRKPRR